MLYVSVSGVMDVVFFVCIVTRVAVVCCCCSSFSPCSFQYGSLASR